MNRKQRLLGASLGLIVLLLSGCIPGVGSLIEAPRFSLAPNGAQLVRLNPPGVGPAAALFRFDVNVENPNSFGLELAGLDFDFFVEGNQVARSQFREGVQLAANGRSQLTLDVSVPLREGIRLLVDLGELIVGQPTDYRLDGTVSVRALGSVQRLPELTIVSGTLTQPIRLGAPNVQLVGARTGVREINTRRVVVG
ncbi:MAG: LEA type 2 family protein [Trueperaceae bacterium]|nr:LEA type 2 family protein [Trueperaceae bacterium]